MILPLLIGLITLLASIQAAWIYLNGQKIPRPDIDRAAQTIGDGPLLRYVVMGDSTAVSQGGEYAQGYAAATARYLAASHQVTWANVAISGARADTLEHSQLEQTQRYKPDVVLIAVGANDVTHLTSASRVVTSLRRTIRALHAANPHTNIVLTGSPDMGAVPRFPQPMRWFMGVRTRQFNKAIEQLAARTPHVVFAPIARQTGPVFRAHPELFAADKFHANTAGWKLWTPVIIKALESLH